MAKEQQTVEKSLIMVCARYQEKQPVQEWRCTTSQAGCTRWPWQWTAGGGEGMVVVVVVVVVVVAGAVVVPRAAAVVAVVATATTTTKVCE